MWAPYHKEWQPKLVSVANDEEMNVTIFGYQAYWKHVEKRWNKHPLIYYIYNIQNEDSWKDAVAGPTRKRLMPLICIFKNISTLRQHQLKDQRTERRRAGKRPKYMLEEREISQA